MTVDPLPLVSVVMPSLNQARFIESAIESVLDQNYRHVELIVVDGGSVDETLAVLQRKAAEDSRLRWLSEPDTGPANALNKAFARVRGTIVGWLNSDDLYLPGAVRRAVAAFQANPAWLMVYGQGRHIDEFGKPLNDYPSLPPSTPVAHFSEGCFICQPTVFFQRSMWILLGRLDENLKTAFDLDYWLRAFPSVSGRLGFVDALQAYSRLHKECITLRSRRIVILEGMQVLARHLGNAPKEWLMTYVNELLAMPSSQRDVGNLKTHIANTLATAKPWLRRDDVRELELHFEALLK